MIAAGLCLMGGCFAQAESSAAVDTYWASEKVAVPAYTAGGSLGVYQHDVVPTGVLLADCHVYTRQVTNSGQSSFFFVMQGGGVAYNAYMTEIGNIGLQNNSGGEKFYFDNTYPVEVILSADSDGIRISAPDSISLGPCAWDSTQPGTNLRMLDARNGEKDFYVSHGAWGWKWYLLPMRSPIGASVAVFDFEEKVLIEL